MTEFKIGIYNLLKKIVGGSSFTLAVIYTIGHIVIAMICNFLITGAALELAAIDAIVEPMINGVWFYVLHNSWIKFRTQSQKKGSTI
jgi:uncharacterized membrane protein